MIRGLFVRKNVIDLLFHNRTGDGSASQFQVVFNHARKLFGLGTGERGRCLFIRGAHAIYITPFYVMSQRILK